jgi:signal transduction histidine kinase
MIDTTGTTEQIGEEAGAATLQKDQFRVLVVDDDNAIIETVQFFVENAGHPCLVAENGKEALAEMSRQPVDLVITDIHMPVMTGIELGEAILKMGEQGPKIIFMTAARDYKMVSQLIKMRPFGFLEKPFTSDRFSELLDAVFQSASSEHEQQQLSTLLEQKVTEQNLELEFRTDRLLAEKELLQGIIREANFGLIAIDPAFATYLLNDCAGKLLGMNGASSAAYFSLPLSDLLPEQCRAPIMTLCQEVFAHGVVREIELNNDATGKRLHLISYGVRYRETISAVILIVRDITERDVMHRQLLQSAKLASIGELAAGVAHEINNPLGFVTSNCNTLSKYIESLVSFVRTVEGGTDHSMSPTECAACFQKAKADHDIDYICTDLTSLVAETLDGLGRVSKIVRDLKTFARVGDDSPEPANVNALIDDALNLVRNEIKYKLTVERQFGELPALPCLANQLVQVFTNMFINAAHAVKESGTLTITTGTTDEVIRIGIKDSGEGIPEGNLSRIFDPFYTTKPPGKGTGMGLSISYGIIQRHGGRIAVSSKVGVGTEFTIDLPIRGIEAASTKKGAGS